MDRRWLGRVRAGSPGGALPLGLGLSLLLLAAGAPQPARADTYRWDNDDGDGEWDDEDNWTNETTGSNDDGFPGAAGDVAIIPRGVSQGGNRPRLDGNEGNNLDLVLEPGAQLETFNHRLTVRSIAVRGSGTGSARVFSTGGSFFRGIRFAGPATVDLEDAGLTADRAYLDTLQANDAITVAGNFVLALNGVRWHRGLIVSGPGGATAPTLTIAGLSSRISDLGGSPGGLRVEGGQAELANAGGSVVCEGSIVVAGGMLTILDPLTMLNFGSTGATLQVSSGTLELRESLSLGGDGDLRVDGGTLRCLDSLHVNHDAADIVVSAGSLETHGLFELGRGGADGTLVHDGGTIRVSGGWDQDGGDVLQSAPGALTIFEGGDQNITITNSDPAETTFARVEFRGTGTKTVSTTTSGLRVGETLSVFGGATVNLTGDPLHVGGATTVAEGRLLLGSAAHLMDLVTLGDGVGANATLENPSGTLELRGGLVTGGSEGRYLSGGPLRFAGNGPWSDAGSSDFGSVTILLGTTITAGSDLQTGFLDVSGALTLGNHTLGVGGNLTVTGMLNWGGAGTLALTGGASPQVVSLQSTSARTLDNLVVDKSSGSHQVQLNANGTVTAQDTVTLTRGILDLRIGTDFATLANIAPDATLRNITTPNLTHRFRSGFAVLGAFRFTGTYSLDLVFRESATVEVRGGATFRVEGNTSGHHTIQDENAGGGQWTLQVDTSESLFEADYVRVTDSRASGGLSQPLGLRATNSLDGGNDTNWSLVGRLIRWTGNGGNSSWNTAANWTPGPPMDRDWVRFDHNPATTLSSIMDRSNLRLGILELNGFTGSLSFQQVLTVTDSTQFASGTISTSSPSFSTGALRVGGSASLNIGAGGIDAFGPVSATGGSVNPGGTLRLRGVRQTWSGSSPSINWGQVVIDSTGGAVDVSLAGEVRASSVQVGGDPGFEDELALGIHPLVTDSIQVRNDGTCIVGDPIVGQTSLTTGLLDVSGTLEMGGGDLRLTGNLGLAGTWTLPPAPGRLIFAGSGTQTWGGGGVDFGNVRHEGATLRLTQPVQVRTFVQTAGSFLANGHTLTVTGVGVQAPLVLTNASLGGGTVEMNATHSGGFVELPVLTYGTLNLNGAATYRPSGSPGTTLAASQLQVAAGAVLNTATVNAAGMDTPLNVSGPLNVAGELRSGEQGPVTHSLNSVTVPGAMTLGVAHTVTATLAGDLNLSGGSFQGPASELSFSGGGSRSLQLGSGTHAFGRLTVTGPNLSVGGAGPLIANGPLVLQSGALHLPSLGATSGGVTLAGGTLHGAGTLAVRGNWTGTGGSFVHNDSTVRIEDAGSIDASNNAPFHHLAIDAGSALVTLTGGTLRVEGDLDVLSPLTPGMTVVRLAGTGEQTLRTAADGSTAFDRLEIATIGSGTVLQGDLRARALDITGGGLDLGDATVTLSDALTPLSGVSANFRAGTSEVVFQPPGGSFLDLPTFPAYHDLSLLGSSDFRNLDALGVLNDLQVGAGARFLPEANLSARAVTGMGRLDAGEFPITVTLLGDGPTPLSVTELAGLAGSTLATVIYAGQDPEVRVSGGVVYGNLSFSGAGVVGHDGAPTSELEVAGSVDLGSDAVLAPATVLRLSGPGSGSITLGQGAAAGTADFAHLILAKANASDTITLRSLTGVERRIDELDLDRGVLNLATRVSVADALEVGAPGPGQDASLVIDSSDVTLELGRPVHQQVFVVYDRLEIGDPMGAAENLEFILGVGDRLQFPENTSELVLRGANLSPLRLRSSSTIVQAQEEAFFELATGAIVDASRVSVQNNYVRRLDGMGNPQPLPQDDWIVAAGSFDLGNTEGWDFAEGDVLRIAGATALGSSGGTIDRVRLSYTFPLDFSSLGSIHERFFLDLGGSSLRGTASAAVVSPGGNQLEIVFGRGVPRTDVSGLRLRYLAPLNDPLVSTVGVPASADQTFEPTSDPPLVDGAAPVIEGVHEEDADGDGALDWIRVAFPEPVSFSPRVGQLLGAAGASTDTAQVGADTVLYLRVAGEDLPGLDLNDPGPRGSGPLIARTIQEFVRDQVRLGNPPMGHSPLNRPAYLNFRCEFREGRYLLQAGVPLRYDPSTGSYRRSYADSTVEVRSGMHDYAPALGLAPGLGVATPGRGFDQSGISASAPVPLSTGTSAGTDSLVSYLVDGEDPRIVDLGSTVDLERVAERLEAGVREEAALQPPYQEAYSEFVAFVDRAGTPHGDPALASGSARLVLVSGTTGPGSQVVVLGDPGSSGEEFANVAHIGSRFSGAVQLPGSSDHAQVDLDGLTLQTARGENLLRGRDAGHVSSSGNGIVVEVARVAGSALLPSRYFWAEAPGGSFLRDRALVPNRASAPFTNQDQDSNVIIAGDDDQDHTLEVEPGMVVVDASASLPLLGTTGVQVVYTWTFVSGPEGVPTPAFAANGPELRFAGADAGTYLWELTSVVLDGAGNPVVTPLSDGIGRQVTPIAVVVGDSLPLADAGGDQYVVGAETVIDSSASHDPNGGAIALIHSAFDPNGLLLSGAFDDPTSPRPTFRPLEGFGSYQVTVTAYKLATGQSARDSVEIVLDDPAQLRPVADAGPDRVGRVGRPLELWSDNSSDAQERPLDYRWSVSSGPEFPPLLADARGRTAFVPALPGTYVISLTVSADGMSSRPDTVTVNVIDDLAEEPRRAPAAEPAAANLVAAVFADAQPQLAGAGVILADGTRRAVELIDLAADPGDAPDPARRQGTLAVEVAAQGAPWARAYVTLGAHDPAPAFLELAGGERLPVLRSGRVGESFVLDATGSWAAGNATHAWTQDSGPLAFLSQEGELLAVIPSVAGTSAFSLVVSDELGQRSFLRSLAVPVLPPTPANPANPGGWPNPSGPPLARIRPAAGVEAVATPGGEVFTATARSAILLSALESLSHATGVPLPAADPGANLSFAWTQVRGPTALLAGVDGPEANIQLSVPGYYVFQLRVRDDAGVRDTARIELSVSEAGREPPVAVLQPLRADEVLSLPAAGPLELELDGLESLRATEFLWSQPGGVPAVIEEAQPGLARVRLAEAGRYAFALQVTDGASLSAPARLEFVVAARPEQPLENPGVQRNRRGGCALAPAPAPSPVPAVCLLGLLLVLGAWRRGRSLRVPVSRLVLAGWLAALAGCIPGGSYLFAESREETDELDLGHPAGMLSHPVVPPTATPILDAQGRIRGLRFAPEFGEAGSDLDAGLSWEPAPADRLVIRVDGDEARELRFDAIALAPFADLEPGAGDPTRVDRGEEVAALLQTAVRNLAPVRAGVAPEAYSAFEAHYDPALGMYRFRSGAPGEASEVVFEPQPRGEVPGDARPDPSSAATAARLRLGSARGGSARSGAETVRISLVNPGYDEVPAGTAVTLYLSRDKLLDPGDPAVDVLRLPEPVGLGEVLQLTRRNPPAEGPFPADPIAPEQLPPGSYYLLFELEAAGSDGISPNPVVPSLAPILLRPASRVPVQALDFELSAVAVQRAVVSGEPIAGEVQVRHRGVGSIATTTLAIDLLLASGEGLQEPAAFLDAGGEGIRLWPRVPGRALNIVLEADAAVSDFELAELPGATGLRVGYHPASTLPAQALIDGLNAFAGAGGRLLGAAPSEGLAAASAPLGPLLAAAEARLLARPGASDASQVARDILLATRRVQFPASRELSVRSFRLEGTLPGDAFAVATGVPSGGARHAPVELRAYCRIRPELGLDPGAPPQDPHDDLRAASAGLRVYDREGALFDPVTGALLPTHGGSADLVDLSSAVPLPVPFQSGETLRQGQQKILAFQLPDLGQSVVEAQLLVTASSQGFDPHLELYGGDGRWIAGSDDSGLGRDAILYEPVAVNGAGARRLYLLVSSARADQADLSSSDEPFVLSVAVLQGAPAAPVHAVGVGNLLRARRAGPLAGVPGGRWVTPFSLLSGRAQVMVVLPARARVRLRSRPVSLVGVRPTLAQITPAGLTADVPIAQDLDDAGDAVRYRPPGGGDPGFDLPAGIYLLNFSATGGTDPRPLSLEIGAEFLPRDFP